MRYLKSRLSLGMITIVLALLSSTAHAGTTRRVCPRTAPPDYATIQAAVDASAAGDFILVCPGIYNENVVVPAGKDHLSIEMFSDPDFLINKQKCGSAKVVGNFLGSSGTGFELHSRYVELECLNIALFDQGIFVGGDAGNELIEFNTIQDNNTGISFHDSEGNSVLNNSISQNVSNGVLDFSTAVLWQYPNVYRNNSVQYNLGNGIDIADTIGTLEWITNSYTRAQVLNNQLNNNFGDGVLLNYIAGVLVQQNSLSWNGLDGVELINSSYNRIASNQANENGGNTSLCGTPQDGGNCVGIRVHSTSTDNTFSFNHATNNFVWDAQDNSSGSKTAGTANTWIGNVCPNDSPPGICN